MKAALKSSAVLTCFALILGQQAVLAQTGTSTASSTFGRGQSLTGTGTGTTGQGQGATAQGSGLSSPLSLVNVGDALSLAGLSSILGQGQGGGNQNANRNAQFGGGRGAFGGGLGGGRNQFGNVNRQGGQTSRNSQTVFRTRLRVGFSAPAPSPEIVRSSLQESLSISPLRVSGQQFTVAMVGGPDENGERTAVLSGTVASEDDRQVAALMAMMKPGISKVQNDLKVVPASAKPATTSGSG